MPPKDIKKELSYLKKKIEEKNFLIEELTREKSSLLKIISHDIRSPFNRMFALVQLMELEFQFNMQLAQAEARVKSENETKKEDRKDERTKIQATQQSELIDQRKNNSLPKNFESSGNDVFGGIGLGEFEPR